MHKEILGNLIPHPTGVSSRVGWKSPDNMSLDNTREAKKKKDRETYFNNGRNPQ
jgi:hypothetical protein